MPPVGFEPTILAGERRQTYALDRAATGTDTKLQLLIEFLRIWLNNLKFLEGKSLIYFRPSESAARDGDINPLLP